MFNDAVAGEVYTAPNVEAVCVWSTSGMTLTRENSSTEGRTCPSATLSTTNPT